MTVSHHDWTTIETLIAAYWWVIVFFVFPAIGGALEEVTRWNRRRVKAKRRHQIAMAKARAAGGYSAGNRVVSELPSPPPSVTAAPAEDPGLAEARATLRLRYAAGELTREEFLQAKVELEDL